MRTRLLVVIGLAFAWLAPAVHAQVPTEQQLELLRTMSPEDREALMEQLGVGGGALSDLGSSSGSRNGNSRNRDPNSRLGANGEMLTDFQRELLLEQDKSLKANDTVLIEIDFKKDKPPRTETMGPNTPTVQIPGEAAPELTPLEKDELQKIIDLVRSRNPYQLDRAGAIALPGSQDVILEGLDEEQATKRLAAVQRFAKLDVKVVKLPVRKAGVAGLKPFGQDLFKNSPSTFVPTDVPVPSDYVVGPGDQLNIQLFGNENRTLRLTVGRDGRINFPEIGPIAVGGRRYEAVAAEIERRVSSQKIGVRVSVGMGDTRSIRVFVMGEANRPGSYTVSGLATMTSALYAAGGVKGFGSLRDIQLKRGGAVVRHLDLYDLLLRGDTSDDAGLLSGDVIFIPPAKTTVAVDGEVNRPAIYEVLPDTSVNDIIALAGGLTSEADRDRVAIVRIGEESARAVVNVPLRERGASELLRNGDSLRVLQLRPTIDRGVTIEGFVFRPGVVAWREGMRLTDALPSFLELRQNADPRYIFIRRELPPDRRVAAVSADLGAALRAPTSAANPVLMPRDRIIVFDTESGREQQLKPVLDELRRQSSIEQPSQLVRIDGRVKARGEYPLEIGMRVSDLLRAGGGLEDAAYAARAELTRYRVTDSSRNTTLIEIDLEAIVRGDATADLELQPFDFLTIREVPEWSEQERVTLEGEVRFPGVYPIRRGETLRSVLKRAGGFSGFAFPQGAVFTREELKNREQAQIDRLAIRLQNDLATTALQAAAANQSGANESLTVGQSLLSQLKSTEAVGRLVIKIDGNLEDDRDRGFDLVLREGDRLMVPKQKQEVTVIGEVQTNTSHFYQERVDRDGYIAMSGGLTRKADKGRIYIVRADGSVVSSESSGWFRSSAQAKIQPGDTVVVPLDTERMPALPLWQAVTSIVYNLAIAAAAVNSF